MMHLKVLRGGVRNLQGLSPEKAYGQLEPTTGDPRQPDKALTGISVPIGNRIVARVLVSLCGYTSDTLTLMGWLQQ
ncbi:hypothetical protein [Ferrimicrobium sp.]|uniref:hypothetical protein n=1 Tax=Ferrimicrobium sp. TaxID=2926050 RepID=UPI0026390202|nr:hypothetical protein [Ferrimicrobium sp.]